MHVEVNNKKIFSIKDIDVDDPIFVGICPTCTHIRHNERGCITKYSVHPASYPKNATRPDIKHCPCQMTPQDIQDYDLLYRYPKI